MRDLRYGLRLLVRAPGYAALAVVTMALGIGATTLLFGVVYGVLLRPLPVAEPAGLVRASEVRGGRQGRVPGTLTNATYRAWSDAPATIESIGSWRTSRMTVGGAGDPRLGVAASAAASREDVLTMTPSLLAVLRIRPIRGRAFVDGDVPVGGQPSSVVMLAHGVWQDRYGGRDEAVGESVMLDGRPRTIVGILPADFVFPSRDARFFLPWVVPDVMMAGGGRAGVILTALARLRPGATAAQAAAEATARARSAPDFGPLAMTLFGARDPIDVRVVPVIDAMTADVRPAMLMMLGAVALLLVAATSNVAGLQLARATTRRRELAIRAAVGASTASLARQLLVESLLVGAAGGLAGVWMAMTMHRLLPAMLPDTFPRADAIAMDLPVLGFAVGITLLSSVLCGLLPMRHARRLGLVDALGAGASAAPSGWRTGAARARTVLMTAQVAIAALLLIGGALLTRTLVALADADRGYDPAHLLTAQIPFPTGYPDSRRTELRTALLDRLRTVPDVRAAAVGTSLPLASAGGFVAFTMASPLRPDMTVEVQARRRIVTPGYFAALGLRLVAGRTLTEADGPGTRPAVVVNRSFVRDYLENVAPADALGLSLGKTAFRFDQECEVVGVADDTTQQDVAGGQTEPEIFASYNHITTGQQGMDTYVVVRTLGDPAALTGTLRAAVADLDGSLALESVMTMADRLSASLAGPRAYAVLLVAFAGAAAAIAGVGLFGLLAYAVTQRTREMAVRTAVGATPAQLLALVLRQGLVVTISGLGLGLVAAAMLARGFSRFLYSVPVFDPVTFFGVSALILVLAVLACVIPARRAARVDPIRALRAG